MSRVHVALAAVTTLLVALPASASASSARVERSLTIKLISTPGPTTVNDVAPKTMNAGQVTRGDMVIGTSVLQNAVRQFGKAKTAIVGRDRYVMTVTTPPYGQIRITVTLPGGTIRAQGRFRITDPGSQTIPVVGGTGAFTGARGTAVSTGLSGSQSLNVYVLRLP